MMHERSGRWARVASGFALAAASVFVASMSHVAAGGHGPGPLALLLTMVFAVVACTFIGGRALTLPRLIAGVALSQLLLHALFALDGGATGTEMASGHHGVVIGELAATTRGAESDAAMWVAHAAACAVTVVLIRWGHLSLRALRGLARPLAAALRRALLEPGSPRVETSRPSSSRGVASPRRPPWARSVSRRGPPLLSY